MSLLPPVAERSWYTVISSYLSITTFCLLRRSIAQYGAAMHSLLTHSQSAYSFTVCLLMHSTHSTLTYTQPSCTVYKDIVTIPCLYLHFISSLLAIHFLFSSNPLLAFLLISSSIFRLSITQLSITQLFIIQPFYYSALYYSALYYSAFSLFSSITQLL